MRWALPVRTVRKHAQRVPRWLSAPRLLLAPALARSRLARLAAVVLGFFVVVGLLADGLAGDLPLACRQDGRTFLLPSLSSRPDRVDRDRAMDWAVWPCVRFGPFREDPAHRSTPPSWGAGHPMGTDTRGRDVFARVIHGTRTTLFFAAFVATVFTVVGALAGTFAGFVGGVVDGLLTRVVEIVSAFPVIAVVVVVLSLTGSRSELTVFAAIAAVRWTDVARVVRAEVLRTRNSDYARAARALGASPVGILARHILPNAVLPAVAASSFGVATVILVEATVDFLGFGSERATGWGAVLAEVRAEPDAWWILLFPGGALFACLGAIQVVAEAVRDGIDPRLRDAPAATRPTADTR